ncbi:TetR/AcrR family transcriptional regulator [Nocardioides limicola]|uniref:TetR/AcrR family transcriptional regulator n=1 Tax=Nocardioides limicola TaxID=2803368 RepID=UPI00193BEA73|nr:TetR/AcrR family transcriptional regulator [Nocardioides sp. DJM-14]
MTAKTDATTTATAREPGVTAKGRATRARLLAAAQEQLRQHGTLEIADVAAAAGVAQSVIHRYFGNKAGLVEAVVSSFYDDYDQAVFLADLATDAGWLDREALRIEQEVAFLYDHPLGRRVASGLLHDAAATRVDAERTRQHADMAAKNIRKGQSSGELPDTVNPDLVGAAIIGALRAVLAAALSLDEPPSRDEVVATVTALSRPLLQS